MDATVYALFRMFYLEKASETVSEASGSEVTGDFMRDFYLSNPHDEESSERVRPRWGSLPSLAHGPVAHTPRTLQTMMRVQNRLGHSRPGL